MISRSYPYCSIDLRFPGIGHRLLLTVHPMMKAPSDVQLPKNNRLPLPYDFASGVTLLVQ